MPGCGDVGVEAQGCEGCRAYRGVSGVCRWEGWDGVSGLWNGGEGREERRRETSTSQATGKTIVIFGGEGVGEFLGLGEGVEGRFVGGWGFGRGV